MANQQSDAPSGPFLRPVALIARPGCWRGSPLSASENWYTGVLHPSWWVNAWEGTR